MVKFIKNWIEKKIIKSNNCSIIQLGLIFVSLESLDIYLDHTFGLHILHSFIQVITFSALFLLLIILLKKYRGKTFLRLINKKNFQILQLLNKSELKGIQLNKTNLLHELKITKPTLKKRLFELNKLKYIYYEKKGKNVFIKLTNEGRELLK